MEKYLGLISLHLIGDFYLQSTKVALCKNAKKRQMCVTCKKCEENSWVNYRYLCIHSLLYTMPFVMGFLIMKNLYAAAITPVLFVAHVIVDTLSCYFYKYKKQTIVFIIDQAVHVAIIGWLYKSVKINFEVLCSNFIGLKLVFAGLILVMPCSVLINKLFRDVYPDNDESGMFDVGAIIGVMERVLTFIFALYGSFPAIAIIITVKTWARTNDLKDKDFRNKYLLGTLTSLVLALVTFAIYESM